MWARGFRFSFTPLPGSFSPFPHGTILYRSLWVFSLGGWSPLLPARFHVSYSTLVPPAGTPFTRTGLSPSPDGFPKTVRLSSAVLNSGPQPRDTCITVWAGPLSLAATRGIDFSFFSSRYLDVSVPGLTFHTLWIYVWMHEVFSCGFPHSEIRGSKIMCISPRLIAAYHVFLRPKVPRHPPRVLIRLTTLLFGHHCVAIHSGFFACSTLHFAQDNQHKDFRPPVSCLLCAFFAFDVCFR